MALSMTEVWGVGMFTADLRADWGHPLTVTLRPCEGVVTPFIRVEVRDPFGSPQVSGFTAAGSQSILWREGSEAVEYAASARAAARG
jgi:hypothetical protein